jgi:hypothetical protein
MAKLVRTQGSHGGKWVYSVGHRCVLGRHAECDISDIFAGNVGVSRCHAQLEFVGGQYCVKDNGSRNGTFLNGELLTARTPLRSGDRLAIADVELIFLEEADAAGPETVAPPSGRGHVSFAEPKEPAKPLSSLMVAAPGAGGPLVGYSGEKLRALLQMLKHLGRSLDIDATLHELLTGLFAIFPQAQCGFVSFTAQGQEDMTTRATHFNREEGDFLPNPGRPCGPLAHVRAAP